MIDMDEFEISENELAFYNAVREYVICLLIFIALYGTSYLILRHFKTRPDKDELYGGDDEDYLVYRISIGAVLLLPFSIVGNEIHMLYPNSWYFKWLSSSLIYNLWNNIFLLSNLCLFVMLPFAYFFIESQGFSVMKKGIRTRVVESLTLSLLLMALITATGYIIQRLVYGDDQQRFISRERWPVCSSSVFAEMWNYHLPYLYSYVSLFGVLLLLTCTPIGFATIFTEISDYRQRDLDADLLVAKLEEKSIQIRLHDANQQIEKQRQQTLKDAQRSHNKSQYSSTLNAHDKTSVLRKSGSWSDLNGAGAHPSQYNSLENGHYTASSTHSVNGLAPGVSSALPTNNSQLYRQLSCNRGFLSNSLTSLYDRAENELRPRFQQARQRRLELESLKRRSFLCMHNVKYPLYMMVALCLTAVSLLLVLNNIFRLMVGLRSLPVESTTSAPTTSDYADHFFYPWLPSFNIFKSAAPPQPPPNEPQSTHRVQFQFGDSSLSILGVFGATIHVVIIIWFMASSLIGLYAVPLIGRLRPRRHQTNMTKIILNCTIVVVLSSALPVVTNTLGVSPFDLLGAYGQLGWLSNLSLVLTYNTAFAAATTLCLVTKFTASVRAEIFKRLNEAHAQLRPSRHRSNTPKMSPTSKDTPHIFDDQHDDTAVNNNTQHLKHE